MSISRRDRRANRKKSRKPVFGEDAEPIEARHRDMMNALARGIDEALNGPARGKERDVGFVLFVFNFDKLGQTDEPRFNYISNADRLDVVSLMKEMVTRFDSPPSETKN